MLHDVVQPQLFMLQLNGTFTNRGNNFLPPGFFVQSPYAAVADFTGNGFLDAVVVRRGIPSTPILLEGRGVTGLSVSAGAFPAALYAASVVAAGDVTGDSIPDVVLAPAGATGNPLRVLANNGSGQFTGVAIIGFATGGVADLEIGRIDSDNRNDLAILQSTGSVDVALSRGGQFNALRNVLPRGLRQDLALADLESDNDGDLYVLGSLLEDSLLLGDRSGSFFATEEVSMPVANVMRATMTSIVDVTGDGDPDLVNYDVMGTPTCLVNDGSARFTAFPTCCRRSRPWFATWCRSRRPAPVRKIWRCWVRA